MKMEPNMTEEQLDAVVSESLGMNSPAESAAYEGGLATYPTVLLAEQGVLRRRRTVADLDARALTLDVQLVRALGGGFHAAA